MRVRFWGTRGSIARPGPSTLRYGGNTSCVDVRSSDGTIVVIDIGTGAFELGQSLLAEHSEPQHGHLLISHTHWDHVQGFPFFAPLFAPGWRWSIYAPGGLSRQLEQTLAGQMSYEYFPIDLDALNATVDYHELGEGELDIGSFRVRTQYLNHPSVTLGYRLRSNGMSVVYACDHEPSEAHPPAQPGRLLASHREDQRHIEFLRDADLVIHDAQYTEAMYPQRVGWGHTPVERAVGYAIAADVKSLALTHHDPGHDDDALDAIVESARAIVVEVGASVDVFGAAEGGIVELEDEDFEYSIRIPADTARTTIVSTHSAPLVLVVDDDETTTLLVQAALMAENYRVITASDAESGLERARAKRPDLILLDQSLPGMSGLELCRVLRAENTLVPIILCSGLARSSESIAAGFEAGVSDYILKPFKPAYLRARVHNWLLRPNS